MLIYTNRQRHAADLLRKIEKEKPLVKKREINIIFSDHFWPCGSWLCGMGDC
jgi:hypothetical protein